MDNIVKFDKPYKFEGKEYDSLDLSGMEKMTVQDLIDIQKNIGNEMAAMSVMEMTTSFAQEMAVKATGKPVEFFKLMPRGKIKKVQAAVIKGMDNSENADEVKKQLKSHTLKFAAPYTYEGSEKAELKGKTFDSIDLSGVGELNTMSECRRSTFHYGRRLREVLRVCGTVRTRKEAHAVWHLITPQSPVTPGI